MAAPSAPRRGSGRAPPPRRRARLVGHEPDQPLERVVVVVVPGRQIAGSASRMSDASSARPRSEPLGAPLARVVEVDLLTTHTSQYTSLAGSVHLRQVEGRRALVAHGGSRARGRAPEQPERLGLAARARRASARKSRSSARSGYGGDCRLDGGLRRRTCRDCGTSTPAREQGPRSLRVAEAQGERLLVEGVPPPPPVPRDRARRPPRRARSRLSRARRLVLATQRRSRPRSVSVGVSVSTVACDRLGVRPGDATRRRRSPPRRPVADPRGTGRARAGGRHGAPS